MAHSETFLNPILTGWIGIAIAIAAVFALITLGLLYSGIPVFGPINDLINAIGGLLSGVLVWQFHALLRERAPATALAILLVAWLGVAAISINSVLVAFGRLDWKTGGMYTAFGFALLGIWLIGMLRLAGPLPFLTAGLTRLAMVAATGMLFGLLAGPLLASSRLPESNPLVWAAYLGAAAGWLLYPIWCWLIGRALLRGL